MPYAIWKLQLCCLDCVFNLFAFVSYYSLVFVKSNILLKLSFS